MPWTEEDRRRLSEQNARMQRARDESLRLHQQRQSAIQARHESERREDHERYMRVQRNRFPLHNEQAKVTIKGIEPSPALSGNLNQYLQPNEVFQEEICRGVTQIQLPSDTVCLLQQSIDGRVSHTQSWFTGTG
jgi:hypothetical protein